MRSLFFSVISILVFLLACKSTNQTESDAFWDQQKNILDVFGVPQDPYDRSISSFTDLGAWHAYALPDDSSYYGGFIGPFSMARENGVWIGRKFAQLKLMDEKGKKLDFSRSDINQFPGWLEQNLFARNNELKITLKLFFTSNRTVAISAELVNLTGENLSFILVWEGETWHDNAYFTNEDQLNLKFTDSETSHQYTFSGDYEIAIGDEEKSFAATNTKAISIEPQGAYKTGLMYSVLFEDEIEPFKEEISFSILFTKTQSRWRGYLESIPYPENHWLQYEDFSLLTSKAIQTLIINWKSAAGELKHDGLFPSYKYRGFHGFWAWDSWKHSVALATFAPELAKSQVLAMFDFQDEHGMIADCIFRDTLIEKHNWRDSKPPLAAWAVQEIFEQTNDRLFVEEMLPRLIRYHTWWYENRDNNGNGLCEYGSTDGTRVAAAWESGMDNAVRFDHALMLQNNEGAWSLDQESVDLNAYLYFEKRILARLAAIVNDEELEDEFTESSEELYRKLLTFYDEERGYFFDRNISSDTLISVHGPEGWIPLWTQVASDSQAKSVADVMLNQQVFNAHIPLPTLDISHPNFDPTNGYWRGPVWLDQAYFGIKGLENYGYSKEAIELRKKLVYNAEGILQKGKPIRENYHPLTGEGLNAEHFSWSAAHLVLLIMN